MDVVRDSHIRVGRRTKNEIVLDDPGISRFHLEFAWSEGGFFARELGSRNGTEVNGQLLNDTLQLQIGDCIKISDARIHVTSPSEASTNTSDDSSWKVEDEHFSKPVLSKDREQLEGLETGLYQRPLGAERRKREVSREAPVGDFGPAKPTFAITVASFVLAFFVLVTLFFTWLNLAL